MAIEYISDLRANFTSFDECSTLG